MGLEELFMEGTDIKIGWRLGNEMRILCMDPQIFPIPGTAPLETKPRKSLAYFSLIPCSEALAAISYFMIFDLLPPRTANELALRLTHFWNHRQSSEDQRGLDSQQGKKYSYLE